MFVSGVMDDFSNLCGGHASWRGNAAPESFSGCEARAGRRLNVSGGESFIVKLLEIRFS